MEWKREEFSVRAYDQGYELKFRGQVVDRYGSQDSRNDHDRMHYFATGGTQQIDQLMFMRDTEELDPALRAAIVRVDAKWGTCRQCGKPFRRNSKGRRREFCDNGNHCSALWHSLRNRAKKRGVSVCVILYTQGDIVKHVRVVEDRKEADIILGEGKAMAACREDEDCDMVICEVE